MKRTLQALATGVVCLAVMGGVAAAATNSSCTISGTGAGSTNVCQFDSSNKVIYTCVNDILVVNGTNQTSASGVVQSNGNTSVGNVSSGNAINSGETTTNVDATCIKAPAVTPAVTTPVTPTGGQGAGEVAAAPVTPAAAPTPVAVAALPKTGSSDVAAKATVGVAITGAIMAVSQLGIQAYRRFALK